MSAWRGSALLTWRTSEGEQGKIRLAFTAEGQPRPYRMEGISEWDARRLVTLDLICRWAGVHFAIPPDAVAVELKGDAASPASATARWWQGLFRYGSGICAVSAPEPGCRLIDLEEV